MRADCTCDNLKHGRVCSRPSGYHGRGYRGGYRSNRGQLACQISRDPTCPRRPPTIRQSAAQRAQAHQAICPSLESIAPSPLWSTSIEDIHSLVTLPLMTDHKKLGANYRGCHPPSSLFLRYSNRPTQPTHILKLIENTSLYCFLLDFLSA